MKNEKQTPSDTITRDLVGYADKPIHANWPNKAKVAVQFVLNYEEGGENSVLYGDKHSETFLSESVGAQPVVGARNMSMESMYEYGSRVGVWRLLDLFRERQIPLTIFGVAMALERNPKVVEAMLKDGHEIASHGWRWIDYQNIDIDTERQHMEKAIEIITNMTGERPLGWYTGRVSPNTRKLVVENGGFLYDADAYNDDLPYWQAHGDKQQLIVPYTLDCNDMKFAAYQGFNTGEHFYQYLKDQFDWLYKEGATSPKMMSIGLHCRLVGKPARIVALARFIDYVQQHSDVWFTRRIDIARHWHKHHSPAK